MYELVSENLSNMGGPMGSEDTTTTNFRKLYKKITAARTAAEKDFGSKLKWTKTKDGERSPDMGFVMYHINKLKTED